MIAAASAAAAEIFTPPFRAVLAKTLGLTVLTLTLCGVLLGKAIFALKFSMLSLAVNLLALVLLFVPGLNLIAFFGANAFLLGRGFFELAALRYCSIAETKVLLRRHAARILLAGCFCAALAAIPIVNLLTPLFATALLVRVAHPLVRRAAYLAV